MALNFKFKDWIFNKLPSYFHANDTYKDAAGEGLLKRYLRVFGEELDRSLVEFIHKFTDVIDLDKTPNSLLPFIGWNLGSPPDITGVPDEYRKLLTYIVSIYKIKGTVCSYKLLFNILGLNVDVYEYPIEPQVKYDSGFNYDEGNTYDTKCWPCTVYDLVYYSQLDDCTTGTVNSVDQTLLDSIQRIVCLLQPIDTVLGQLTQGVKVCEPVSTNITNTITIVVLDAIAYDKGYEYDTGINYDDSVILNTYTYIF